MEFDLVALILGVVLLLAWLLYNLWWRQQQQGAGHKGAVLMPLPQGLSTPITTRSLLFRLLPMLRILALIALVCALARPRIANTYVTVEKEGIAIQMLIDRSTSMQQELWYKGQALNRLEVVKRVISAFILGDEAELGGRGNDLIGISGFARYSEEYAPLTTDHKSLVHFIQSIGFAHRVEDGTMIGDALYQAVLRMLASDEFLQREEEGGAPITSRVIILLTDGRQTQGGYDPLEAARFAAENGITVYTIAILRGSASVFDQGFAQREGVDVQMLQSIAEITGGRFGAAGSGQALLDMYAAIDQLEKTELSDEVLTWQEYYHYFLLIAFALVCAEQLLLRLFLQKI